MPRVHPHPPRYFRDDRGVRWRVYDQVPVADGAPVYAAPGQASAQRRVFVREGDRWVFDCGFRGDDPRDLGRATINRQIRRALGSTPRVSRGESLVDYMRRQQLHLAAHPDLFPRGVPAAGAAE